jgi:uncharacterized protein (TIGR00255 family)
MLLSMTGYGRAETREGGRLLSVEVRSVNHRFAEISVRLPKGLASLENRVRDRIQERLSRGKITCNVAFDGEDGDIGRLRLDEAVARRYAELLRDLKKKLNLTGDLDLTTFVGLPDVLTWERTEQDEEAGWKRLSGTLDAAIEDILRMKRREGELLARDLSNRLESIVTAIRRVEARIPLVVDLARTRMHDRLAELLKDQESEYQRLRLEAEVVLFADRTDCTEECIRLRAHCQQFLELIEAKEPAGRKLTFLLQEMNREANTIGSKSLDVEIAREVIQVKEEAERLREQVANIE